MIALLKPDIEKPQEKKSVLQDLEASKPKTREAKAPARSHRQKEETR